jgi:hypothetical protein
MTTSERNKGRILKGVLIGCGLLIIVGFAWSKLFKWRVIQFRYMPEGSIEKPYYPEGESQLKQAWALWRQRQKRDVSKDLLPFLTKRDPQVRLFAMRALAKLDTPLAATTSSSLPFDNPRDAFLYNLAKARIGSRKIKGQARFEKFSKSSGVPWDELVEKSKIINGKSGNYFQDNKEAVVIEEIVDILYYMTRQGKNIEGLASDLKLNEVQELRLQGARLTEKEEAELLTDFLIAQKTMTGQKIRLTDYLVEIGQPAIETVMSYQKDQKIRRLYSGNVGYAYLFRVAKRLSKNYSVHNSAKSKARFQMHELR